jgi:hypothetical protein
LEDLQAYKAKQAEKTPNPVCAKPAQSSSFAALGSKSTPTKPKEIQFKRNKPAMVAVVATNNLNKLEYFLSRRREVSPAVNPTAPTTAYFRKSAAVV